MFPRNFLARVGLQREKKKGALFDVGTEPGIDKLRAETLRVSRQSSGALSDGGCAEWRRRCYYHAT